MPEIKLFYKNCNCCSGSGSGSASGSDSQAGCDCRFLTAGFDDNLRCDGFPVVTECKKNFVVNIYINFSGCGSTPIANCSSGSAASGPETGLDIIETGSGSIPCLTTCPNCCDLVPKQLQINLECIDDTLASTNLIDGFCGSSFFDNETGSTCLGRRSDKCTFFIIKISGSSFGGAFAFPIDNGYLAGGIDFANVVSCDPFQLSGSLLFGRAGAPVTEICLAECLTTNTGTVLDPGCITGTFTITEALP
jgi:hypothetical protein